MRERDTLAARCTLAASAAVAPKRCNVRIVTRVPFVVEVDELPAFPLTAQERTAALTAAQVVNPRELRSKAPATLVAEIETWIGVDVTRLRKAAALALAVVLTEHPRLARALGVPIQGDE